MKEPKISAVIITRNEEQHIQRCLDSLAGVADEIIVVDSFSTDETPVICKTYPSVFFVQKTWAGYSKAKNYGNFLAKHAYILSLDADEALSDTLKQSILIQKKALKGAYAFNRLNFIGNHAIKHSGWYPDTKIRLFPKNTSEWVGDYAHEKLMTQESVQLLKGDLWHYSYYSIYGLHERFMKYAELGAEELFFKGCKIPFYPISILMLFKFIKVFILKLGFLDGFFGYKIALESAKATAYKYRHLKKLQKFHKSIPHTTPLNPLLLKSTSPN